MTDSTFGFIYNSLSQENALQSCDIGREVSATVSPWLVYYDLVNIPIHDWPGNLWFVEIVSAFYTSIENYSPAITIKPLKKLPCSLLFGPQGDGICLLLDKIIQLSLLKIEQLELFASPLSDNAYANAWNCWLKKATKLAMHHDTDHTYTLAIGLGEEASPINGGFLAIEHLFRQKIISLVGDAALVKQVDSEDTCLAAVWRKACSVLLHMAMGIGAEQYVAPLDLPILLSGLSIINNE